MCTKKRSIAQRIGETGEALVKLWASKNQLSANKFGNDFGFDFMIQHFQDEGEHQTVSGLLFAAQCKATEKEGYKYVKLDKSDASLYLASSVPTCILGVDNNTEEVKFRFVDFDLIDKLVLFTNSDNKSLNLQFDTELFSSKVLQEHIIKNANSSMVQKLKIHTVEKLSPGIKLRVSSSTEKSYLHIDSEWLSTVMSPDSIFNRKGVFDKIIDLNVLAILDKYLPSFNILSISGSIGIDSYISASGGECSTLAISYPYNENVVYRLKSGFELSFGPCIEKDGVHYHEHDFEIKKSDFSLVECEEDCLAFAEMYQKKTLAINGHVMFSDLSKLENYENYFFLCKELYQAHKSQKFDFSDIVASDLNDYDTFITLSLLAGIINHPDSSNLPLGFLIDSDLSASEYQRNSKKGSVPLVFTVNNQKYVAHLESDFSWLADITTKEIIGFEIDCINSIEIKEFEWNDRSVPIPELWLTPSCPAIPISGKSQNVHFNKEDRPFQVEED